MNLTISISDFLSFATHNGLFDSVSLVNNKAIAKAIEEQDSQKQFTVIEWYTPEYPILWSVKSWIVEQKRRKSIGDITADGDKRKMILDRKTLGRKLLMEAAERSDIEAFKQIKKEYEL
jgi:hypothetical protein